MPTSLWAIADKAREDKQHRFGGVARLLTPGNLKRSFKLLKKKAAPGVDKVTWQAYQEDLEANVAGLGERLKANQYRAGLVRRKYIPKRERQATTTGPIKDRRQNGSAGGDEHTGSHLRGRLPGEQLRISPTKRGEGRGERR